MLFLKQCKRKNTGSLHLRSSSPNPDCEASSNISPQIPHGRGTQFLRQEPTVFSLSAGWGLKLPFYFLQTLWVFFIPLRWAEKANILVAFPLHTRASSGFSQAARAARSIPGVSRASWNWAIWNPASSLATQGLIDSGSQHLDHCLRCTRNFTSLYPHVRHDHRIGYHKKEWEGHGSPPGAFFLVPLPPALSSTAVNPEPLLLDGGHRG